jgi:rod shape-determining protein MreC
MPPIIQKNWQLLFLVLIVAGIILLSLSGYANAAIRTSVSPLVAAQQWVSTRFVAIYEFFTVPRDVYSLRQRNAELEDEVSKLQTRIIELQQQLKEADVLYALLDFARARPENQYIACSVIGRDPSPFFHYIIIDHGSDDGIRHGMPVVTAQGLVGRVDAVISNAARVQLLNDVSSSVNIHLQNSKSDAVLRGSITGDISIDMVNQEISVSPGDLVLTSGLGGNYPSELIVGQVASVKKLETDLFQTAAVQPAVDFINLKAVLVITNFKPVDITPLISTPSP